MLKTKLVPRVIQYLSSEQQILLFKISSDQAEEVLVGGMGDEVHS